VPASRSTAESASGNRLRQAAESAGRVVGHFTTPCPAGMNARQRSPAKQSRWFIADTEHTLTDGIAPKL
jgi:hypothetical protein